MSAKNCAWCFSITDAVCYNIGKAVEEGASNVLDAEQGSVERAELADAESMDEDVTGSTKGGSSRYNGTSAAI